MKITDYFPPSSPPVLLPEVPLPPSSPAKSARSPPPEVADCDQASDRSEGDSGKENEEEPPPPRLELAGGSGGGGRGKDSKSGGGKMQHRHLMQFLISSELSMVGGRLEAEVEKQFVPE